MRAVLSFYAVALIVHAILLLTLWKSVGIISIKKKRRKRRFGFTESSQSPLPHTGAAEKTPCGDRVWGD